MLIAVLLQRHLQHQTSSGAARCSWQQALDDEKPHQNRKRNAWSTWEASIQKIDNACKDETEAGRSNICSGDVAAGDVKGGGGTETGEGCKQLTEAALNIPLAAAAAAAAASCSLS
jgi:hypothetical protein